MLNKHPSLKGYNVHPLVTGDGSDNNLNIVLFFLRVENNINRMHYQAIYQCGGYCEYLNPPNTPLHT